MYSFKQGNSDTTSPIWANHPVIFSVVRGGTVKVGDQVYVDCQYSEHLPFKWNAICVQILPQSATVNSTYIPQPPGQTRELPTNYFNQEKPTPNQYPTNARNFTNEFKPPVQGRQRDRESMPIEQTQRKMNQQQTFSEDRYNKSSPYQTTVDEYNPAFKQQITYTSTPGKQFFSSSFYFMIHVRFCICVRANSTLCSTNYRYKCRATWRYKCTIKAVWNIQRGI